MALERRPVDRGSLRALFRLKVLENQQPLVAPNEITIAQQAYEPASAVWGLWDGETAVGLLAMIDMSRYPDPEEADDRKSAYIWRLMIGADYQGKGHGRAAIAEAEVVAREWGLSRLSLSFVDVEDGAEGFYLRNGFVRTGHLIDGEVQMVKVLPDT